VKGKVWVQALPSLKVMVNSRETQSSPMSSEVIQFAGASALPRGVYSER
jgi:hypothetical protein